MTQLRNACFIMFFLVSLLLPCVGYSQEKAQEKAPATEKPAQKRKAAPKEAPHASARHMGESLGAGSSWYLDGTPSNARGAVWEQGVPMESLSSKQNRRYAPSAQVIHQGKTQASGQAQASDKTQASGQAHGQVNAGQSPSAGVDTTKGIESALGEISSYERQPADGSAMGLNKPGVPSLQMTTEESSWRNPVTQPPTTGQEVMTTRRNVVGAYADVVKSDDLHVTLGPELHIPETDPSVKRLSPHQNDSGTLGFGMKWQWDF